MDVQLNTLYVLTRGATLRRNHLTVQVICDRQVRLTVPIHQLESIAVFGGIHVTPALMALCADRGVAINFLTESGRLLSRVDAPTSGNVMVRREQFRSADLPDKRTAVAQGLIAGKIHNARNLILRAARESATPADQKNLSSAAAHLADTLPSLELATSVDSVRGLEGDAARAYFGAFTSMVRQNRNIFQLNGRNRRPPLDPMNALLSFLYGLLLADCTAAATAAGLDPCVGFLHVDRPGRPGFALDLMEEFRPLISDRIALAIINRQQVKPNGFQTRDGGAVTIDDATRRVVIAAYQERKKEEVFHPLLEQKTPIGRLPFLQARIMARYLRGDLPAYVPCILKN